MKLPHRIFLSIALIGLLSISADAREWEGLKDDFKVEAEFVQYKDGWVQLRLENGRLVSAPLSIFDPADQFYVYRKLEAKIKAELEGTNLDLENGDASKLPEMTNSIGMKFKLIPPGEVAFGSRYSESVLEERFPKGRGILGRVMLQQAMLISEPLYFGMHEVTVGQFKKFIEATNYMTTAELDGDSFVLKDGRWSDVEGHSWRNPGYAQDDDHPVTCISGHDAIAFCQWLSKKEGRKYRLPTEVQWEYACRAGTDTLFFWGDDPTDGKGYINGCDLGSRPEIGVVESSFPFDDGYAFTSPVDKCRPNPWGLYGMHGNVGEWCADLIQEYPRWPIVDLRGTDETLAIRGGAWSDEPLHCRSAKRSSSGKSGHHANNGFRILCRPKK